jgi:Fur family ferric uptake transcriptional regulator
VTVSPDVAPLTAATVAEAVEALRERGLRLSTSRRLVLEALFAAEGPVSAEHVARRMRLDAASVHRNFETLERHGLVRHVHLGHGPGLYALLERGESEYLYCERCGAVRTLPGKELDAVRRRIEQRYGFRVRFDHFAIVGTCAACSAGRSHEHAHADGAAHDHPHTGHDHPHADHDHGHVGHEHQHSHGDRIHSHPHLHQEGLEDRHEHRH